MSLKPKRNIKTLKGFSGGLNKDANASMLEEDELLDARNVVIGQRGELIRRTGWTDHGDDCPDTGMQVWNYTFDAEDHWTFIVDDDGDLYVINNLATAATDLSVDWTVTDLRGKQWFTGIVNAYNTVYFCRRTGSRYKWNGQQLTAASTMPFGIQLLFKDEHVFCASTTTRPSGVLFSNPFDPETWDAGDYLEFDPEDGATVWGMAVLGDDIVVFKDRSVHLLTGKSKTDFAQYKVSSRYGCVSPRTIEEIQGSLFFFDRDHGVIIFDGAGFTQASEKIDGYVLGGMNYDYAYKASAYTDGHYYYLSVPWGTATAVTRTFVLSIATGGWTEWPDLAFADVTQYGNRFFFVGKGLGLQEISGDDDNGTAISIQVQTPWYFPAGPMTTARLMKLEILHESTDATMKVRLYRDYATGSHVTKDVVLTDDGTPTQNLALVGWGRRFEAMSLLINQTGGTAFQINSMSLATIDGVDLRGGAT